MFNTVKNWSVKHSPEILTGVGIAGMITTTVLAVKATPKALAMIEQAEREKHADTHGQYHNIENEPLTKLEVVKVAWKPYVPAAVTGVLSIACLIGASATNYKRNAALATAYQVVSTTLADYKEQVVESIGEKKEKTIREKMAQKQVDEKPINSTSVIITGKGDTWFLEPWSGRCFQHDIEDVKAAINRLNYSMQMSGEPYTSMSQLYDELGLAHTVNSDDMGWNYYKHGLIEYDLVAVKMEDGRPCLKLDYYVLPDYKFNIISY